MYHWVPIQEILTASSEFQWRGQHWSSKILQTDLYVGKMVYLSIPHVLLSLRTLSLFCNLCLIASTKSEELKKLSILTPWVYDWCTFGIWVPSTMMSKLDYTCIVQLLKNIVVDFIGDKKVSFSEEVFDYVVITIQQSADASNIMTRCHKSQSSIPGGFERWNLTVMSASKKKKLFTSLSCSAMRTVGC